MRFKLHPGRSTASRDALRAEHAAVVALGLRVWLWQEEYRLGVAFASASDYAESKVNKSPETSPFRNLLVNLKVGGAGSLGKINPFRHPRERALHALCLLLWKQDGGSPSQNQRGLHAALLRPPSPFQDLVASYKALWQRVN
jgi:hypothetical protein